MKQVDLLITKNEKVGKDIYRMRLEGDTSCITKPGQFINIELPGHYLRRPISVSDYDLTHIDILFKVLGQGTKDMTSFEVGKKINCLIGLGNGFDTEGVTNPTIIVGGIGVAPAIGLAKKFNKEGIKPLIIYGARSKDDVVLIDELKNYGELKIATDDGSLGFHGNVVDFIKSENIEIGTYFACGPFRMLESLVKSFKNDGFVSLEARMGCGFGACMGCSIKTTNGPKRVCKEGPVFKANEVIF